MHHLYEVEVFLIVSQIFSKTDENIINFILLFEFAVSIENDISFPFNKTLIYLSDI